METWTLLKLLFVFFVLYVLGLYVYRLYFDPLAKIPGPKIAAFKEAEEVILPVLQHIDAALGADHSQTMIAKVRLARILNGQRRWRESDSIFLKAIERGKKVLGEEHDLTLDILRFYASSLWSQGRWREAVAGFFGSSRGIRTLRACMGRRKRGFFTEWLGVPLIIAIFAIAYVWSDKFTRLG